MDLEPRSRKKQMNRRPVKNESIVRIDPNFMIETGPWQWSWKYFEELAYDQEVLGSMPTTSRLFQENIPF